MSDLGDPSYSWDGLTSSDRKSIEETREKERSAAVQVIFISFAICLFFILTITGTQSCDVNRKRMSSYDNCITRCTQHLQGEKGTEADSTACIKECNKGLEIEL